MARRKVGVLDALDLLESVLSGGARAAILDELTRTGGLGDWLRRLRASMAAHSFGSGSGTVDLGRHVRRLENRTRQDGFRVLHSWNHATHRFTDDIVPVLMLDFFERAKAPDTQGRFSLAILLDFYFLHLLTLCSMRVWDDGDPDGNLERLTEMLGSLQGSSGSGHRFVSDAETLLIYALSQFHPEEQAYDRIIAKVVTLGEAHQVTFARVSAAVLSAHLRWGFWLMYERDAVRMRRDNVGDYPWLLNSLNTLMRAYSGSETLVGTTRAEIVEGLLQGLAADPWAFSGKAPPALTDHEEQYRALTGLLTKHRGELLADIESLRPNTESYSPLALHFNFPHNTLVALLTIALLEGRPQTLSLNALLTGELSGHEGDQTQEGLARTLMEFSRASPDRLGHQGAMLVAYDPLSGLRSFTLTVDSMRAGG